MFIVPSCEKKLRFHSVAIHPIISTIMNQLKFISIATSLVLVFCGAISAGSPALDRASEEVKKRAQANINTVDCVVMLEEIRGLAKTNLPLAVQECNLERIHEIDAKRIIIANTPERLHWKELQLEFVRIEFQILQALFDMQEKSNDRAVERRYQRDLMMCSAWTRTERAIPIFETTITNKTLLKELFPPDGVPRVIPPYQKPKDTL